MQLLIIDGCMFHKNINNWQTFFTSKIHHLNGDAVKVQINCENEIKEEKKRKKNIESSKSNY